MVEYIKQELQRRVGTEGCNAVNWEVTERIQNEPKYVAFNQWAKENGVIAPSVRYPVAFGEAGQLIGCAAKRPVGFNEAFVYVPMRLVICESKILQTEVGPILKQYPELFTEGDGGRTNGEHLTIMLFLLHEMSKGEASFWYPYFQISESPDQLSEWPEDILDELQDPILKLAAQDAHEQNEEEFELFLEVAAAHSDVLDVSFFTYANFMRAHTQVTTRCFGTATEIMVVPFADCANHHVTDSEFHLLNHRLAMKHLEAKKEGKPPEVSQDEAKYFTKERTRVQFMKNFVEAPETDYDQIEVPYKSQRYSKKLKLRQQFSETDVKQFCTEYADQDVWELRYVSSSVDEDNDSEESSEESDGEESEEESEEEEGEVSERQK